MFGEVDDNVDGEHLLTVDAALYGHEAIFRACYAFTDRCYLFLRPAEGGAIAVHFRKRQSPKTLEALVAEFANELVNQRVKVAIAAETRSIREMIVAQAFAEGDL